MNDTPFMPTREQWETAQKKITQLVEEHQAHIERIARLETELEALDPIIHWQYVDDRMPEFGEGMDLMEVDVAWIYDNHPENVHFDATVYHRDDKNLVTYDGDFDKQVIAWRYIPPILVDLVNPGRKP